MAEIIKLVTPNKGRDTKSATYTHGGQRYTCTFDRNAPADRQWVWIVDYVQTYRYVGSAATMDRAAVDARRKIHSLNKRQIDQEEASNE
jgi:hypothetical protein